MAGLAGKVGEPPAHYAGNGKITPFQVWDAYRMDPYMANAVKYLFRWDKKDSPLEDLKKALHYTDELIARVVWIRPLVIPPTMHIADVLDAFKLTGDVSRAVSCLLGSRMLSAPLWMLKEARAHIAEAIDKFESMNQEEDDLVLF